MTATTNSVHTITPATPDDADTLIGPNASNVLSRYTVANVRMPAPEMVVPPYVFGVESRECNVYFGNLFPAAAEDYLIDAAASLGTHQNERWTWTPAGAVASGTLVVSAHDKRTGTSLVSGTMQIRAAAASAGTGATKKILVIGDSLVAAGAITQTVLDVAGTDVMAATMLGTLGTGLNKHEGRSGWNVATYTTDYPSNPFWIGGAVNFAQYLVDNSVATPDWVLIALGINDVYGQSTDAAVEALIPTAFTRLDTLIASIKAADANVKVGLVIPPPPSFDQDSFGANYGSAATRWRHKRSILIWARELIAQYAGEEASRIYLVPSNTALDTVNNMSRAASAPVNSRSAVSSTRQSNGVHPATAGYQQIADAWWAFLKYYA
jgi:lysophospholipase L1-like esterase